MKLIHMADMHLAAVPERGSDLGKLRERELWQTFCDIIDLCEEEQTDLLLIAGDLFHRAPLVKELKEVDYRFRTLSHTRVVMIAGNHDYIGVNSHYRDFAWSENVTFLNDCNMQNVYFEDLNTRVYGFSYHERDVRTPLQEDLRPISAEEIAVLMVHGGEPDKVPFQSKKLERAGFDYVALGHIHMPHFVFERAYYAGSPEPLDKNEIGEHGIMKAELTAHGAIWSHEMVPIAKRKYIILEQEITPEMTNGEIRDLLAGEISMQGADNMYRIRLTGCRAPEMVIDTELLRSLGYVVEVTDETIPDYDFEELARENSENVLGMFIRDILKQEASDEVKDRALNYGVEALLGEWKSKSSV